MKVLVLCFLVAVGHAAVVSHYGHEGGTSHQYRNQDASGHYAFGYDEDHSSGGSFRREQGSGGAVSGTYGLKVADGRQRVVDYVADAGGFRASVSSNEPGVAPSLPASASYNAGGHGPAHHPAAHQTHGHYYANPYHAPYHGYGYYGY